MSEYSPNLPLASAGPSNFADLQDILSIAWSPDGSFISTGDVHGVVQTYSMADGSLNDQFTVQQSAYALSWPPRNSWAPTAADASGTLTVSINGDGRKTITTGNQPIFSISWSPNGKFIAAGGANSTVGIWQAPT